jgi:hypothetical protein
MIVHAVLETLSAMHRQLTRLVLGKKRCERTEHDNDVARERFKNLKHQADELHNQTVEIARESGILVGHGFSSGDEDNAAAGC